MKTINPFSGINLYGEGVFRGVTLAIPDDVVRPLLPPGLMLGPQDDTRGGTHPVILSYNSLANARMSVPSLVPALTYSEFTLGIPHTYIARGEIDATSPGPYYYMPRLYLNSWWAVFGGIGFWGFPKAYAGFDVGASHFRVRATSGERLTSLTWETDGDPQRPVDSIRDIDDRYRFFLAVRRMLDQPLVSQVPPQGGPIFVVSDFQRRWDAATMRPLTTTETLEPSFQPNFKMKQGASLDATQSLHSVGIDDNKLGSYELIAPWRLSLPYLPIFPAWP